MEALDTLTGLPLRRISVPEFADRMARQYEVNLEREERTRFEGNRRARRKAAAQARKVTVAEAPLPISADAIRAMFAEAKAEVARNQRIAEHMERTREWQAVQALQGVIIDTATPEQRAAREAAWAEERRRIEEAEGPSRTWDADLPAVGSFA
jgi:hypothetical protein